MKRLVSWIVLICSTALPAFAQDAREAGTAAAIRALEREWTVGHSRNDNRALNMIFDNALVYVEYGALVSKADYLSRIKQQKAELDQVVMEPMTVRVFGSTAIVVGTYVEKQLEGTRRKVKRWRFLDTWVYKKNGWVLVAAGAAPITR